MYAGPFINRAARIASLAPRGHVLTTATVWEVALHSCVNGRLRDFESHVSGHSREGYIWAESHGWHNFKGVRQPFEIVQIKDSFIASRAFPRLNSKLLRVSSHTAEALRRTEFNHVTGNSSIRDEDDSSDRDDVESSFESQSETIRQLEQELLLYIDEIRELKSKCTCGKSS